MSKNHMMFVKREGAEKHLAFRTSEWLNADICQPVYGIQAQVMKGVWCHLAHEGSPLIFKEKSDARAEIKRLQASSKALSQEER